MMIPVVPKKQSRTPKSLPKESKFKRMKRRLQLKAKVNRSPEVPIDPQLEDDVTGAPPPQHEEQHIEPEPPTQQQDGEDLQDDQVGKKNQTKNWNRSSPMKIVRLCKKMTPDQRQVIISADFGETLKMRCSKLIPGLCRFLMGSFNPDTCELDFGDRGKIPVDLQSVVSVMGVPMGTIPVSYKLDHEATRIMLDMFGINDAKQPLIASLEKELGPSHPPDQIFLRKFMIYLVCSVFAPTTGIAVSPRCYPSLIKTEAIRNLNWPKFIIDIMIQTARAKEKKSWFKACMPYLMVRYVDSLETDAIDVPQNGTRIAVWTNKLVKLVVDLDTNDDGSFGKLPLKSCYRNRMVLFTAGPSAVDMFIRSVIPGDHNEDDLAQYRVAVTEMCTVFEDGLAQFLKNLSLRRSDGPQLEEEKLEVQQASNRSRHRKKRRTRKEAAQPVNEVDNNHGVMDTIPTSDQLFIPTTAQKESRKRKPDDGNLPTDSQTSKMLKSGLVKQSEPVKETEKVMLEGEEQCIHQVEDTFELDMEIATSHLAPIRPPIVHHISDRNVSTKEGTVAAVESLKQLQGYGAGSQSSADSSGDVAMLSRLSPAKSVTLFTKEKGDAINIQEEIKSAMKKSSGKSNNSVSFADQQDVSLLQTAKTCAHVSIQDVEPNGSPSNAKCAIDETSQGSPIVRRPVTRSMSPIKPASPINNHSPKQKKDVHISGITSSSPRRPTRFATAEARSNRNVTNPSPKADGAPQGQSTPSLSKDSMSRKLELDFASTDSVNETDEQRRRRELIEDCPSFDLGIDEPPDVTVVSEQHADDSVEELVVISSNEQSGDSLDEIYATIEMPAKTPVIDKAQNVQDYTPLAPDSYTPVPHAHQKRVVKTTAAQKSPFVQMEKKHVAAKTTSDVYNKLVTLGGRTRNELNKKRIIDSKDWFIFVWDLADSIKPTGWLSNSVCEFALHVLSPELAKQKKCVMELSIGTKLRNPNCIHDQAVQKAFEFSSKNRLDHKEQIMFSVLQDLTPNIKLFSGHYYLIVLNLKAERFEVMDSLRPAGTPSLKSDYAAIVGSIKYLWALNYQESKIDISRYRTQYIEIPRQKTSCDCGYFMLKSIEEWDGRRMTVPFSQSDMPIIRKLQMQRWLDWEENEVSWQDLLFPK